MDGNSRARKDILEIVGSSGWLESDSDTAKYLTDWRGIHTGTALGVVRPSTAEQVQGVVRICADRGIAIVPQGGNTGLVLGGVPTESGPCVLMSLDRMNRVRSIDADNFSIVAEAGCIISNVQEAVATHDRQFPFSIASEGSATIGGTLSTNAGGNNTVRFGNAREQVLGLEVVLPDGTLFDGLNTLRKNNTGYDLKHLFIGGEGTLGIITAAAMRLVPAFVQRETAFVALPDPHAAQRLLSDARSLSGDSVLAFELMPRMCLDLAMAHLPDVTDPLSERAPWYVLIELATSSPIDNLREKLELILERGMSEGLVTDGVIAESESQRAALWHPREGQAEAAFREGRVDACDASVPVAEVATFIDRAKATLTDALPGVRICAFGHMGDGNIHYAMFAPLDMDEPTWRAVAPDLHHRVDALVQGMGGSFSAEHGIGAEKREQLREFSSSRRLELMGTVRRAIDPNLIMNPGKIL